MLSERVRRLNAVGFDWNPQDPRHAPWEQRYSELVEFAVSAAPIGTFWNFTSITYLEFFKVKYGHARVPLGWKVGHLLFLG